MLDVGEAEEVAVFGVVAGFGGYGDLFVGVGVEGGVLGGGFGGRRFLFPGVERCCEEAGGYQERGKLGEAVGLHGQVDYHLG